MADGDYDEFGLFHENAAEWGIPFDGPPAVSRHTFQPPGGPGLSYLRWGEGEPAYAFLHGGGQNAHTWDTVLLALGRPALAFDLPGHGHSDRRDDKDYGPWRNAEAVTPVLDDLAPGGVTLVGMSLGGATAIRLAATRPDLFRRVVVVDVTPAVNAPGRQLTTPERGSVALIAGPPTYDSFEEMAEAAVALSPLRSPEGVRRGVRHNSHRLADGRWAWRYDLFGPWPEGVRESLDFTRLWDDVSAISVPALFVRGGSSGFVRDEDVDELRRRLPSVRVETVEGAGHAVQSDRPLDLVALLEDFEGAGD
jgi:pimeloyl-ACP methyl ester carboxylesterase